MLYHTTFLQPWFLTQSRVTLHSTYCQPTPHQQMLPERLGSKLRLWYLVLSLCLKYFLLIYKCNWFNYRKKTKTFQCLLPLFLSNINIKLVFLLYCEKCLILKIVILTDFSIHLDEFWIGVMIKVSKNFRNGPKHTSLIFTKLFIGRVLSALMTIESNIDHL